MKCADLNNLRHVYFITLLRKICFLRYLMVIFAKRDMGLKKSTRKYQIDNATSKGAEIYARSEEFISMAGRNNQCVFIAL